MCYVERKRIYGTDIGTESTTAKTKTKAGSSIIFLTKVIVFYKPTIAYIQVFTRRSKTKSPAASAGKIGH